jgi:hypothetical protein
MPLLCWGCSLGSISFCRPQKGEKKEIGSCPRCENPLLFAVMLGFDSINLNVFFDSVILYLINLFHVLSTLNPNPPLLQCHSSPINRFHVLYTLNLNPAFYSVLLVYSVILEPLINYTH